MIDAIVAGAEHPTNEYLPTGIPSIDRVFGGGLPQGLHVFAGSPGSGKTTLAVQIAHTVAKRGGESIIFELEMSPAYIAARGITLEAYLDAPSNAANPYAARLACPNRRNPFTAETLERIRVGAERYREYSDRVSIDTGTPYVGEIWKGVEEYVKAHGTKPLVIVDHLRLLRVANVQDPYEAERDAVAALKGMADEHGLAVILIATLNKGGMKSAKGMDAVRGSTDIPFAADTLTLLSAEEGGTVTASTVKNRNGACGSVSLRFMGEYGVFADLDAGLVEEAPKTKGKRRGKRAQPTEILGFEDDLPPIDLNKYGWDWEGNFRLPPEDGEEG